MAKQTAKQPTTEMRSEQLRPHSVSLSLSLSLSLCVSLPLSEASLSLSLSLSSFLKELEDEMAEKLAGLETESGDGGQHACKRMAN